MEKLGEEGGALGPAAGTKPTAFTGEGDQELTTALRTNDAGETRFGQPAIEVPDDGGIPEAWRSAARDGIDPGARYIINAALGISGVETDRETMAIKNSSVGGAALAALSLNIAAMPAAAETRGYVIGWFATATHSTNFAENCPQNKNGGYTELLIRDLVDIGYSKAEATEIVSKAKENLPSELRVRTTNRAVVNGKQVSVYNYPEAVTRDLETVVGRYGYGFDLDGKESPNDFEDPDTHQKVDNQLWRAIGCTDSYRAIPPTKPYPEGLPWDTLTDTSPGWALAIESNDLSKDGDVVVTLDRLTQHLLRDANGNMLSGATYVLDPNSRSHNVLPGKMKDGLITIGRQERIYLESEMPFYAEINLRDAQMRLEMEADGTVVGYMGGYLKWKDFAYMHTARPANGADSIGIYHALKKMADAFPDPKTGENQYISGTFRLVATPAYLANVDHEIVAVSVAGTSAGDAK